MFERFTPQSRRVIALAQENARLLNHTYIGTEHLLLGVLGSGRCTAIAALDALGVQPEAVRERVLALVAGRDEQPPSGHIPFTPKAKKVLELSLREALKMGMGSIGTGHVLLALEREGNGLAAQALTAVPLTYEQLRGAVSTHTVEDETAEGAASPTTSAGAAGAGALPEAANVAEQVSVQTVRRMLAEPRVRGRRSGRDLTREARLGTLEAVAGREAETRHVLEVLSRYRRNNALLVGPYGVGKSALIRAVAHAIATDGDEVPNALRGARVVELGAANPGPADQGEPREGNGDAERGRAPGESSGAGSGDGDATGATAANTARPTTVFAAEDLDVALTAERAGAAAVALRLACDDATPVLASITDEGLAALRTLHPALLARFDVVRIEPVGAPEVRAHLEALRGRLEAHYGIRISDDALDAAVESAPDHRPGVPLAAGAVELLVAAGARLHGTVPRAGGQDGATADTPAPVLDAAGIHIILGENDGE